MQAHAGHAAISVQARTPRPESIGVVRKGCERYIVEKELELCHGRILAVSGRPHRDSGNLLSCIPELYTLPYWQGNPANNTWILLSPSGSGELVPCKLAAYMQVGP